MSRFKVGDRVVIYDPVDNESIGTISDIYIHESSGVTVYHVDTANHQMQLLDDDIEPYEQKEETNEPE